MLTVVAHSRNRCEAVQMKLGELEGRMMMLPRCNRQALNRGATNHQGNEGLQAGLACVMP